MTQEAREVSSGIATMLALVFPSPDGRHARDKPFKGSLRQLGLMILIRGRWLT